MSKMRSILLSVVAVSVIGCGGGGSSTKENENITKKTKDTEVISNTRRATLRDDILVGVRYVVKNENGLPILESITDENGKFSYIEGEKTIDFFVGNMKIGDLEAYKVQDSNVYINEIVGVNRENVNNEKVLQLATFLQSIDSDPRGGIIDVTQIAKNLTQKKDLSASDVTMEDIKQIITSQGQKVKSEAEVKKHLKEALESQGHNVDLKAPKLTSDFSSEVSPSATLEIHADERLNHKTINSTNVKLFIDNKEVVSTISLGANGKTIRITPSEYLKALTNYEVRISNIQDENENTLEKEFKTSFKTSKYTKPSIEKTKTSPANGEKNVKVDSSIKVYVSEKVKVTNSKILLKDGNKTIDSTITYKDKVITVDPKKDLSSNTKYTLTIKKDALLNETKQNLSEDYVLTFTTKDTIAPTLTAKTTGKPNPKNLTFEISSNEDLNKTSVISKNVEFSATGKIKKVDYANKIIKISFEDLDNSKTYTITLKNIKDLSGNKIKETKIEFTTASEDAPSIQAPASTSNLPKNGTITITASEELKDISNATDYITLKKGNEDSKITNVAYSGKTITITYEELESEQSYKLLVKPNAIVNKKDVLMQSEQSYDVTAGDFVAPTFTSSPTNLATNVQLDGIFTLTFDEKIKLDSTNIKLCEDETGSTEVTGGIKNSSLDGTKKVVNISLDNISNDKTYYIIISEDAIKDMSDNKMAKSTIKFTTISDNDTTPPTITTYSPTKNATNVEVNSDIVLTFDENIKNLNKSKFVFAPSVDFEANIDNSKRIVTLHPTSNLQGSTEYTLTISNDAVKDITDNGFVADSLIFTTKANVIPPSSDCPNDFTEYPANSKECYKIVDANVDWQTANQECLDLNSVLLPKDKISTFIENNKNTNSNIKLGDSIEFVQGTNYWLQDKDNSKHFMIKSQTYSSYWSIDSFSQDNKSYVCYFKKATPTVAQIEPINGQTDVSTQATIKITFSEVMKNIKKNENVILKKADNSNVTIKSATMDEKVLSIKPDVDFDKNTQYTITLNPDGTSSAITDVFGNAFTKYESSFTTKNESSTIVWKTFNNKEYSILGELKTEAEVKVSTVCGSGASLASYDDVYNAGFGHMEKDFVALGLLESTKAYWIMDIDYQNNYDPKYIKTNGAGDYQTAPAGSKKAYPICQKN